MRTRPIISGIYIAVNALRFSCTFLSLFNIGGCILIYDILSPALGFV